jgi:transposase-like protein
MEMMGKIRRMYFRDKLSLHQIAKRTGLSGNTIRKWVRAPEATQPAYLRCAACNKLSPFHQALEQALKADSFRAKHNRSRAKAFFEQIKAEGYDGGYSQLTAFIRSWRGEQGKSLRAFVPLTFALGEAFQFDWSEECLLIGGLFRRIQVSHMKLCASRAFWLALSCALERVAAPTVQRADGGGRPGTGTGGNDANAHGLLRLCRTHGAGLQHLSDQRDAKSLLGAV